MLKIVKIHNHIGMLAIGPRVYLNCVTMMSQGC